MSENALLKHPLLVGIVSAVVGGGMISAGFSIYAEKNKDRMEREKLSYMEYRERTHVTREYITALRIRWQKRHEQREALAAGKGRMDKKVFSNGEVTYEQMYFEADRGFRSSLSVEPLQFHASAWFPEHLFETTKRLKEIDHEYINKNYGPNDMVSLRVLYAEVLQIIGNLSKRLHLHSQSELNNSAIDSNK